MTARPDPFHVAVADQVLAALADVYPGPLSTPDIAIATGITLRAGRGNLVHATLTRLARDGQVAKITPPGAKPVFWRRLAAPVALPALTVCTDSERRPPS
jgi:hypothetical protein